MNRIYLNDGWKFAFDYKKPEFVDVRIPHTVKELPFNYFSEEEYQTVSEYRKTIFVDESCKGDKILLTFEGVAHYAEVFLNGKKVGEHYSGYTAFTIDISDKIRYGEKSELSVRVDSRESLNIPPFGNVIDYMTYGGIYRDVYIEIKNPTYISDVFIHGNAEKELKSIIKLDGKIPHGMRVRQKIRIDGKEKVLFDITAEREINISVNMEGVKLWHVDSPNLYTVTTELISNNEVVDDHVARVGFRDAEFKKDGFYLNGKKLKIRGLNRHQAYPYVGYAMPKSMQEMDADVLKHELGLNAVRTSHYPQSHYFIDRCDEIGLLVLTEIPGWQHIGDAAWQEQAVRNTEEMVLQYRNHPSIIMWGVRINESGDNEALYTRTNALAHLLDPTRDTGGIRCFKKSQLLEDVYTYNDFIHDGKKPGCDPKYLVTSNKEKPYIVTEYGGHMFPTKSFDSEEHRVEHAMRHARVLDAIASHEDISGSFGWCMADYNTHKDFGSGDRICYHGVLDMFRNHKLAAAVYSSQQDKKPVLEVSSSMDIGEHPACIKGNIWAFTNADTLRVYKNGKLIKEYATAYKSAFPFLKHSPVLIDDFIGQAIFENENMKPEQAQLVTEIINYIARNGYGTLPPKILVKAAKCMLLYGMKYNDIVALYNKHAGDWGAASRNYRFDAIMNGKVVKTVTKTPMNKASLKADAYKTTLVEETGYDVSAVRISAVDEFGNKLTFSSEPIVLSVSGPIEIVGPDIISLKGGMGGTYVKTTGDSGKATLILTSESLGEVKIDFEVKKA